jgi:DNA-directed RNA polymerase II subunit RPB1
MEIKSTYLRIVDNIVPITRFDFNIQSNELILEDSAILDPNGITVAEIYNNNEPVEGGVIDKRLGVTDRSICATCGESSKTCPGHFGHTKLIEPVFQMGYLPFVKNILSCICIRCGKLLVRKNEEVIANLIKKKNPKQRFIDIRNACKRVTHCEKTGYGCGIPSHKITIEKKYGNVVLVAEPNKKTSDNEEKNEFSKKATRIITPQTCYDIFRKISDTDCIVLGIDPSKSRPEDMIMVMLPISPVQTRPSIRTEILSSSSMDDGLTHKLLDIVKNNENLRDAKGEGSLNSAQDINDDFMLLQYHVATYYANDILGLPRSLQKNKTEIKSISERLKGKEGRVRGNLMGKRVDMSARTVITSDPNIPLDGIGIPLIIAMNLTFPEIVTPKNIDYLTQLVKNGKRKKYPGANYIIRNIIDNNGREGHRTINVKYDKRETVLKLGDIVERHLIDGDIVLFNRQPSLHKLSMMGHRCNIIPDPMYQTFRVNVSVTEPYNADWYRPNPKGRGRQQVAACVDVDSPHRINQCKINLDKLLSRYNYLVTLNL